MNPRVKAVLPTDDYTLEITFTNGEVGIFDCKHLLTFGVFRELKDINYFKTARVELGTVAWPHEQDICPDTLYEDSAKVTTQRAERTPALESARGPAASGESSSPVS
jgi:hypothetical protein